MINKERLLKYQDDLQRAIQNTQAGLEEINQQIEEIQNKRQDLTKQLLFTQGRLSAIIDLLKVISDHEQVEELLDSPEPEENDM